MANLSLKHLYKIYDNGTKAVTDFNLEIKDNEFIVFVGPSGCGKSTTLRMIAGLEDITAGDFFIDGVLANSLEPKDRDMAMVFQNYALYPHMTVYDNMAFGLKIRHVPKTEIDKRVHQAAKILDIEDQLDKKPKAMSGGQRQRVALGRAIVRKPKVFLLDEPLSNLDAKLRSSMRSEITRLHHILGTTFIYVTHDQVEAMTMGTRIVVMKKGVIQQVDTPMNLYDYPTNLFVAGFIGTPQMNFIDAKFDYNDEGIIKIDLGGIELFTSKDELNKLDMMHVYAKEDIVLGVRPEHFRIVNKGDVNSFLLKISNIESLGNEMNIEGYVGSSNQKVIVRTFRNDNVMVGDEIYVGVDFKKAHLFLRESEKTLLPREVTNQTYNVEVKNKKLHLFGKTISLPAALINRIEDNNYRLGVTTKAIIKGDTFKGKVIKKEKLFDSYLYTLKIKNDYVFFKSNDDILDEYISFDVNLKDVTFYLNEEEFVPAFSSISKIDGKLSPIKKNVPAQTRKKDENGNVIYKNINKLVFDYDIAGYKFDVDWSIGEKIYALLGKQFALHDIEFALPSEDLFFDKKGIKGVIKEVLDYGKESYYKVSTVDGDIFVLNKEEHKVGEEVYLNINPEKIGVFDKNFEVTLL